MILRGTSGQEASSRLKRRLAPALSRRMLAQKTSQPWILGSFGTTCVLLFGFPASPFSQPRNIIGGHVLTSLVGLLFLHLLGPGVSANGHRRCPCNDVDDAYAYRPSSGGRQSGHYLHGSARLVSVAVANALWGWRAGFDRMALLDDS